MTDDEKQDLERMAKIRNLIGEMSPQFRIEVRKMFREFAAEEMPLLREEPAFRLGQLTHAILKRLKEHEPSPGAWEKACQIVSEAAREIMADISAPHQRIH